MINLQNMTLELSKKPNSVLFKLNDEKLVMMAIENDRLDPDKVFDFSDENFIDGWKDLSAENPFEFVFCYWDTEKSTIKTTNTKTVIPDESFKSLLLKHTIFTTIQLAYNDLWNKSS